MANASVAWRFHDATKYVLVGETAETRQILMGAGPNPGPALGEQDLAIEPAAFKIYTSLPPIALPRDVRGGRLNALQAIAATGEAPDAPAALDLATLAHLCLRSNGILKQWHNPAGKELYFRAAGCTGARYHLELYLVTADLPDLAAGVYHYAANVHALRQLRTGDFRGNVVAATGNEAAIASAPAIVVCTSTFWRNAWRYQERAYRHVYWDTGTLFTSLLAVAADAAQPAEVVLGFADARINELLDVDGEREAAVALVALGAGGPTMSEALPTPPLKFSTKPISAREIAFPLIQEMHHASELAADQVADWRATSVAPSRPEPAGTIIALRPPSAAPADPIDAVIHRRRSNRFYDAATPLPFEHFSTVILTAAHGTAIDALPLDRQPLHDVYLIVHNVEGVPPGSYVYHPNLQAIEQLAAGDQRAAAQRLACGQRYAGEAHVNVYLLTDPRPVLDRLGNRGYRLAQLEAALYGGKVQLAAHALGLGAVGSTSDDDAVIAHFSPHAARKSFMFVAVFGIRRKPTDEEKAQSTRFIKQKAEAE